MMREEWRTALAEEKLSHVAVAYFRNRKSTWLIRSGTTAYQDRNNLAKISKSEMLRDIKK